MNPGTSQGQGISKSAAVKAESKGATPKAAGPSAGGADAAPAAPSVSTGLFCARCGTETTSLTNVGKLELCPKCFAAKDGLGENQAVSKAALDAALTRAGRAEAKSTELEDRVAKLEARVGGLENAAIKTASAR